MIPFPFLIPFSFIQGQAQGVVFLKKTTRRFCLDYCGSLYSHELQSSGGVRNNRSFFNSKECSVLSDGALEIRGRGSGSVQRTQQKHAICADCFYSSNQQKRRECMRHQIQNLYTVQKSSTCIWSNTSIWIMHGDSIKQAGTTER
jgi:hypothetical protein